jgi:hypothetical protein
MHRQRDGFPEPLFGSYQEFLQVASQKLTEYDSSSVEPELEYLLFFAPLGPLRMADPILAELTVMAREAVKQVDKRLDEIRDAAVEKEIGGKVRGALPEDQA